MLKLDICAEGTYVKHENSDTLRRSACPELQPSSHLKLKASSSRVAYTALLRTGNTERKKRSHGTLPARSGCLSVDHATQMPFPMALKGLAPTFHPERKLFQRPKQDIPNYGLNDFNREI